MAGTVVEHEIDLRAECGMPRIECFKVVRKAGRGLTSADHFDPPPPEHFHTAEHGYPSIAPHGRNGWLHATSMPDPIQVRIRLEMGLILVVQFKALRSRLHDFFSLPRSRQLRQ